MIRFIAVLAAVLILGVLAPQGHSSAQEAPRTPEIRAHVELNGIVAPDGIQIEARRIRNGRRAKPASARAAFSSTSGAVRSEMRWSSGCKQLHPTWLM